MNEGVLLAEEGCEDLAWNAGVGERAGCAVTEASQGLLETLFNWLVGGSTWAVKWTGTAWLSFPEPTIGTADGTPSATIDQIWGLGSFYIMGIAVVSLLVGIIRLVWTPNRQTGMALLRGLAAIITVQAAGIAITALLLDAGSQFSTWIVQEASGKDFTTALADFSGMGGVTSTLTAVGALNTLGSAIAFAALGFLILLIAAFAQVCLLIVRSVLIVILWAFLPFLASAAFTDGGAKALSRAVGWLFALVLYKPVAGIIYAVGVLQMKNAAEEPTVEEQMLNLLIAVVTVGFAALALPALIKFVAPQAAVGASMAFSGGALAAGAVGTGAAVVALGATGGASAAAGAAGTGAAGTGAAGAGAKTAQAANTPAAPTGTGKGVTEGAGTPPTGEGSGNGSPPKGTGQGTGTTSTGTGSQSDGAGQGAESVTGEGSSQESSPAPTEGVPSGWSERESGLVTPASTSSGSSSSPTGGGTESSSAPGKSPGSGESGSREASGTDGADQAAPPSKGGADSSGPAEKPAEKQGADGAEQTAPPTPHGATPTGGSPRTGRVAEVVRDVSYGTRNGAGQVDFNEGQEES